MASKQSLLDKFRRQFFQHINVDEKDFSSLSNLFNERKYPRKTYLLIAGDKTIQKILQEVSQNYFEITRLSFGFVSGDYKRITFQD